MTTLPPLTRTEVEAAVRRYWRVSESKEAPEQQKFYGDQALVFTSSSKRTEPARLVSLRREREYLASSTNLHVKVSGSIDVELLGPDSAVAAYTVDFNAEDMPKATASGVKTVAEHLENARVTHVFQRQRDGALKIVHEHISVAQG